MIIPPNECTMSALIYSAYSNILQLLKAVVLPDSLTCMNSDFQAGAKLSKAAPPMGDGYRC